MAVENGDLENVYGLHRTSAEIERGLGYSGKIFWMFNKVMLLFTYGAKDV